MSKRLQMEYMENEKKWTFKLDTHKKNSKDLHNCLWKKKKEMERKTTTIWPATAKALEICEQLGEVN